MGHNFDTTDGERILHNPPIFKIFNSNIGGKIGYNHAKDIDY